MDDIVERLEAMRQLTPMEQRLIQKSLIDSGTPVSDEILEHIAETIGEMTAQIRPQFALVSEAIAEIKRLRNELFGLNAKLDSVRSVAGLAVAEPLTFANIKKEIRNGKSAEG